MIHSSKPANSDIQVALTKIVNSVANLEHVAENVSNRELADVLLDIADIRRERVEDLSWLIADRGESPNRKPSRSFAVHKAWMGFINHLFTIPDLRYAHELAQQDHRLAHHIASLADRANPQESRVLNGVSSKVATDAELLDRFRSILETYGDDIPDGADLVDEEAAESEVQAA